MKKILFFFFSGFILFSVNTEVKGVTVYTIGDSTMADYDPEVYPNQRGWGQMFKQFFTGEIHVSNAARNGRSSKSFYEGGLWTAVVSQLEAGDYVFIQFGHNDEKDDGASGEVGTTPEEYQSYLGKYVNETLEKGAIPILLTPVVRCYFSGNEITAKGAHNLSETGDELNYPLSMQAVATETGTALIDHTALTKELVESYGPTEAKKIIYVEDDNTHLSITGATLFARLVVQDLIRQNILVNNLNASPDIILNPTTIDFGNCYQSTFVSKSFTISGMDLSPADGAITISASEGFSVGKSETDDFRSSIELTYTGGNLANTEVIIHFEPAQVGEYTGIVSVAVGSGDPKTIALSGNSLAMTGGVEAEVHFPLISDASATITGPVASLGQNHSGMYVKNYASIAIWPEGVTEANAQRNSILSTPADTWPGNEIDIVTSRYIQFAVKPQDGTIFTVDSIGLYAGPAGGNAMGYRVMASTTEDFNDAITLEDRPSNVSNTMVALSYKPILQVTDEETFYLRFYPWYNFSTEATSKYLCLQNLVIKGTVTQRSESGIGKNTVDESIIVFPNPSSGVFYVNCLNNKNSVALVYNQAGCLLYQKVLQSENDILDLTSFPRGVYLLHLVSDKENVVRKLVIN